MEYSRVGCMPVILTKTNYLAASLQVCFCHAFHWLNIHLQQYFGTTFFRPLFCYFLLLWTFFAACFELFGRNFRHLATVVAGVYVTIPTLQGGVASFSFFLSTGVCLGKSIENFIGIVEIITEIQLIKWGWSFRHIHSPPWSRAIANIEEPGGVDAEEDSGGAGDWWECYKVHGQPSWCFRTRIQ